MLVTVAICTWNRAALLDQTLAELRQLQIPQGVDWELLVVNNNCTDDTDVVLSRHVPHLPLKRLFEPRQGKSYAANLALDSSRGDLVLWTDDDVLVDPDWLLEYVRAAEQWPQATFFGGTIDPWFAVEPPSWVRRHFRQISFVYAVCQLGLETRPLVDRLPFGANLAFRRQALSVHRFNPRLGPSGLNQVRGEETELLKKLRQLGHQGVWVGSARVRHYIPTERLRLGYIWEWFRGEGRMLARQDSFQDSKFLWGAPRWAILKYWKSRLKSWILTPIQGKAWMAAFCEAAMCRGIIEETRACTVPA